MSIHSLGRAREHGVKAVYLRHGWQAEVMPGSAYGERGKEVLPIDIIAKKIPEMTEADWKEFFASQEEEYIKRFHFMLSLGSSLYSPGYRRAFYEMLEYVIKSFINWKKEWDKKHTLRHFIQVKKVKEWLTKEEREELIRLAEKENAEPIFVYSYLLRPKSSPKSKSSPKDKNRYYIKLGHYHFENLRTGTEFTEKELGESVKV